MSHIPAETWNVVPRKSTDAAHDSEPETPRHMACALDAFAYLVSERSSGGIASYHNSIVSQLHGAFGLMPSGTFTIDLWRVISNADVEPDTSDTDWSASSDVDAGEFSSTPPAAASSEERPTKRRCASTTMDAISNALRCPVCFRTMDVPCQAACTHAVCVTCAGRIICPDQKVWVYRCPECRATHTAASAHVLLHDMRHNARLLDNVCQIISNAR